MQKVCSVCGEEKPLDAFYDHPKGVHGKEGKCKSCKLEYAKNRYKDSVENSKPADGAKTQAKDQFPPVALNFDKESMRQALQYMTASGSKSFSAAFKSIIENAIEDKLYLKPDAFLRAKSILVQNRFQLFHIKSNLMQLCDGYKTGKVPGIDNQVEEIKQLIEKYSQQISRISEILGSEAFLND